MDAPFGLVLAAAGDRTVVTGLTLAERARRVLVRTGIPAERVRVVERPEDLAAARGTAGEAPVVLVRAAGQVVARELVAPLRPLDPGTRAAVDARGFAGAMRVDAVRAGALWNALGQDLAAGERALLEVADEVPVGARARHPASTPDEVRQADAWQFELIHKPLDSFLCRYLFRPVARPLTRLFLRSPVTPNQITVASIVFGLVGCWIAARPGYWDHVFGLALLFVSGVLDANDGEVARLRLEGSELGGWLDAIGDDVARLGVIAGVGIHVSYLHPGLPIAWVTLAAGLLTATALVLIYWYCIFVIKSSNNQDYTNLLGVGPGQGSPDDKSLKKVVGDLLAQICRRDFVDPAALLMALLGLPELMFAGLVVGSTITIAIVVPTHFKLVRSLRAS